MKKLISAFACIGLMSATFALVGCGDTSEPPKQQTPPTGASPAPGGGATTPKTPSSPAPAK